MTKTKLLRYLLHTITKIIIIMKTLTEPKRMKDSIFCKLLKGLKVDELDSYDDFVSVTSHLGGYIIDMYAYESDNWEEVIQQLGCMVRGEWVDVELTDTQLSILKKEFNRISDDFIYNMQEERQNQEAQDRYDNYSCPYENYGVNPLSFI